MTYHRFSVAPMIDWSDRHFRYLVRLLSKEALLYTEMITANAIIHGPEERLLAYSPEEHPISIQLGGSDPKGLAKAAKIAESFGYDEINLNVGCPSDRVQSGRFGVCLMREAQLVADCLSAMSEVVAVPVTIKTRIGVDEWDSYELFEAFVDTVKESGCQTFIIHARKAWLNGLSPKENRTIPPLKYDYVFQLKKRFPELTVILNGGLTDLTQSAQYIHDGCVDGVMLGREVYHNPFIMAQVDSLFYGMSALITDRYQLLDTYVPYIEHQLSQGIPLKSISRHMLGLFQHQYGGKRWRRFLSERAHRHNLKEDSIAEAIALLQDAMALTVRKT